MTDSPLVPEPTVPRSTDRESTAPESTVPESEGREPEDYPATASRPMESTRVAMSDAWALADLQAHWGSAYVIRLDGDIWVAAFRGCTDELRAHTCLELREFIRADYAYRQQAGLTQRQRRPADPDDRHGGERMSL